MPTANVILWIYIALLVVGGLIGFMKAGSKISLYMSVGFAAALALCAANVINNQTRLADILLIVLMVAFTLRLAKTKKFIPAGMMLAMTIAALALRNIHF